MHVLRFVLSGHVLFFIFIFCRFFDYNSGISNKIALETLLCLKAVRDRR